MWIKNSFEYYKKYLIFFIIYIPVFIIVILFLYFRLNNNFNKNYDLIEINEVSNNYTYYLNSSLKYMIDKENNDISNIINNNKFFSEKFKYSNSSIFSLGFIGDPIWITFSIKNNLKEEVSLVLTSSYFLIDYIEFYLIDNNKIISVQNCGDRYVLSTYDLITNLPYFVFKIPAGETYTIYLKIKTESTMNIILNLYDFSKTFINFKIKNLIQGIFFSILFMLLVIQLLLFIFTKDKRILSFFYYHFSFLIFLFFISDLPFIFFKYWYRISNELTIASISLLYLSMINFIIILIDKFNHEIFILRIRKLLYFGFIFFLILYFLSFIINTNKYIYLLRGTGFIITNVFIFSIGFYILNKQIDNLIYSFYVGWMWGIAGLSLATLVNLGYIKEISEYIPYIYLFSLMEFLIITLGFVYDYKITQDNEKKILNEKNEILKKSHLVQVQLIKKLKWENYKKTKNLFRSNLKLKNSLLKLKSTQEKLINSEKMVLFGMLTSAIVHEIKNPLNYLNTYNEAFLDIVKRIKEYYYMSIFSELQEDIQNDLKYNIDTLEYINKKINTGLNRILNIIDQLRRFFSPSQNTSFENNINIIYCIESALLMIPGKFLNNVEIKRKYYDDIVIYGNDSLLKQVFMNLFLNSLEAMDYQGIITIEVKKLNKQNIITICDSGKGIPKNIQKKIFEPFFSTKEFGLSTGLGLSIVEMIVKKHKGKIILKESEKGKTCFEIKF